MRKRFLYLSLFIFSLFLLGGCESQRNGKVMICSAKAKQGNIDMDLHYEVTFNSEYVKTVKTVEKLTCSDDKTLDGYKKTIDDIYKKYDGVDYYTYQAEIKDNTLTSQVFIDYEHVDIDKILSLSEDSEHLIKNGKIKLSDIKEVYENVGASCYFD